MSRKPSRLILIRTEFAPQRNGTPGGELSFPTKEGNLRVTTQRRVNKEAGGQKDQGRYLKSIFGDRSSLFPLVYQAL